MLHRMREMAVALAAAAALLAATAAAAQPRVSAVRLGEHPDKTRFVVELSQAAPYRVFTLGKPYRVVIDLPQVTWNIPEHRQGEVDTGAIESLRYGLFAPNRSRVVLDAKGPVRITDVFRLPPQDGYPHRLVVDVTRVSPENFLQPRERDPIASANPLPEAEQRQRDVAEADDDRLTIVIDAGHGGPDPGAIGVDGTYEKDLVLTYARHLKERLEQAGPYRVVLTRKRDIFLKLNERVEIANEVNGDLFISLHANATRNGRASGASVFTLSETASDEEAAELAAKENKSAVVAGMDLEGTTQTVSQILIDLAQRETMNTSKRFAGMLVDELQNEVRLLENSHRHAGFVVLKSPNVPSVLLEIGFLSHEEEIQELKTASHRRTVNSQVVDAVKQYFQWRQARR
ncbi:N-acetylmuramoyl-L-alanine amidase [Limimonas halophila]|uniref:N-acetylmuramoyl-L-alanine amidase n=1 Tax=Limimonas halophila TaxID=1082479 RepID=UPI000B7E952F|nr:N-acetylmuramoyl-L-alanine amidase [Limimonas halophila]